MVISLHKYRFSLAFLLVLIAVFLILAKFGIQKSPDPVPEPKSEKPLPQGEFLSWEEVHSLFPKYAEAEVIHVDSGKHFRVQRRGGTYHADVQPLTASDTAVMKTIYDSEWSWKRKAVVLCLENGRKIAASMNGMPHGGGNITDNDFDGHFCIHFLGSKTHGSSRVDPGHQLMVWKAAGQVDQKLSTLAPREVVDVFLAALDNDEKATALRLVGTGDVGTQVADGLEKIEDIRIYSIEEIDEYSYRADIRVLSRGSAQEWTPDLQLNIIKVQGQYRLDPISIEPLLHEEKLPHSQTTKNALMQAA